MKIEHRANFNALVSGMIWGLIFMFAVKASTAFVVSTIIWYTGNILALMLYPVVLSLILRKKMGLWINACFFSLWGGSLAVWGLSLVNTFQNRAWTNLVVNIILALFVAWKLIPLLKHNYALESERESSNWGTLNDFSLIDFLFCRFDTTSDTLPGGE